MMLIVCISISLILSSQALLEAQESLPRCRLRNPTAPSAHQYVHQNQTKAFPACSLSVEQLATGNLLPGTSQRSDELFPPWINLTLAQIGQSFYNAHFGSIAISYLLTGSYFISIPRAWDILLFTSNSGTMHKFMRRFTATTAHFALWARNLVDVGNEGNMDNLRTSLRNVRFHHLLVARHVMEEYQRISPKLGLVQERFENYTFKHPKYYVALEMDLRASAKLRKYLDWPASYKVSIEKALPMNQFLMSLVQWTVAGLIGGFPKAVLINDATEEEMQGFNHFYAVIGYTLGIDDEYNIYLQRSLEEQTKYYNDVLLYYFVPAMFTANKYSKILMELAGESLAGTLLSLIALKESFIEMLTPVLIKSLSIRMVKDFIGIPTSNNEAMASVQTKLITWFYEYILRPASYLPGFYTVSNMVVNTLLEYQGMKAFPKDYTSDESIAQNVFV